MARSSPQSGTESSEDCDPLLRYMLRREFLLHEWLRSLDSNQDNVIQSHACYHYTTPHPDPIGSQGVVTAVDGAVSRSLLSADDHALTVDADDIVKVVEGHVVDALALRILGQGSFGK